MANRVTARTVEGTPGSMLDRASMMTVATRRKLKPKAARGDGRPGRS